MAILGLQKIKISWTGFLPHLSIEFVEREKSDDTKIAKQHAHNEACTFTMENSKLHICSKTSSYLFNYAYSIQVSYAGMRSLNKNPLSDSKYNWQYMTCKHLVRGCCALGPRLIRGYCAAAEALVR